MSQQYDLEEALLRNAINWLEPQEVDGIKVLRICDRYNKGYSDLFICVNGIFVVAELKSKTGTASPQQLIFIREMLKAGAIGGLCRSIDDIKELVEQAKRKAAERS